MRDVFTRRELLSRDELQQLSTRSDWRGGWQFARHLLALCGSGALVGYTLGSVWVLPAWTVHGILLNFLFSALHETVHRTAFHSRRANRAVAWICGLAVNLPPRYFRCFHFDHHRYTQDPDRDPELLGGAAKPASAAQYVDFLFGIRRVWWQEIKTRVRHALGRIEEPFIPASARAAITAEARSFLALYGGVALFSVALGRADALYFWIIPLLIGRPFLSAFLLAEHGGCEPGAENMLANTRTTLTNPLVRALAWNMPYHVEHHLFPGVPFHALHRVYERVRPQHRFLSHGYLGFQTAYLRQTATPSESPPV